MRNRHDSRHNLVSDVMAVNLNMFLTLMKHGIFGDKDSMGIGEGEEMLRSSRSN